jgi:UTP--glucose-1-phosphate uridylyltransferase
MIDAYHTYQKPIIVVEEVPDDKVSDYGIIASKEITKTVHEIMTIVEKPALADAPSRLGAIGRYLLTPDIFPILAHTKPGCKGEIQLTDALCRLEHSIGLITSCTRYDIGDKPGWIRSNFELTLKHPLFGDILTDAIKQQNLQNNMD